MDAGLTRVLGALRFAARLHRDQQRKGAGGEPYVNHLIEVAELLARVAGVSDPTTLQAAVLHDVLEDTPTTPEELEAAFGAEVRRVVEEVTDARHLPKAERKRLQVERAPHLSPPARLIRIADKISNLRALVTAPPAGWPPERQREYLEWADRVVAGCRDSDPSLVALFDEERETARRALADR